MTRHVRAVLGALILTPTIAAMLLAGTARATSSAVKVDIGATPVIPYAAAAWGCLPPGGTLPLTLTVNLAAITILDRPVKLTLPTRFTIGSGGTVTKSDYFAGTYSSTVTTTLATLPF